MKSARRDSYQGSPSQKEAEAQSVPLGIHDDDGRGSWAGKVIVQRGKRIQNRAAERCGRRGRAMRDGKMGVVMMEEAKMDRQYVRQGPPKASQ